MLFSKSTDPTNLSVLTEMEALPQDTVPLCSGRNWLVGLEYSRVLK